MLLGSAPPKGSFAAFAALMKSALAASALPELARPAAGGAAPALFMSLIPSVCGVVALPLCRFACHSPRNMGAVQVVTSTPFNSLRASAHYEEDTWNWLVGHSKQSWDDVHEESKLGAWAHFAAGAAAVTAGIRGLLLPASAIFCQCATRSLPSASVGKIPIFSA